jgi:ferric-dicitrate binding protein FerR (iron transport regulator)
MKRLVATGMTPRKLDWMLRMRGPALHDWPPADHADAIALMRTSAEARKMLADALAAEDEPAPDRAALGRIRRHVHHALAPTPPVMRGIRLGALAACMAAGLYIGLAPADAEVDRALASGFQDATPATVLAALDL